MALNTFVAQVLANTLGIFLNFFFMDFILEENAHGLALKFSQNHGNLENYKHGTVK